MSYDSHLSLTDRIAKGFVGFDKCTSYQRSSACDYLHRIYTVKGDAGSVGSVFYEFVESKSGTKENDHMQRVFRDFNKCGDLFPDLRVPQEAKPDFCCGIQGEGIRSLEELIEKIERRISREDNCSYLVQVVSIEPSALKSNPGKQSAKNYDHIYQERDRRHYLPIEQIRSEYPAVSPSIHLLHNDSIDVD